MICDYVVRPINHPQISPKWYRRRFIPTFRRSGPGQAAGFLTANKDDAKWALKQGHPGILSDRDKTTGTSPNGKNHWDKLWWSDRSSSLFWRSFNLFLGIAVPRCGCAFVAVGSDMQMLTAAAKGAAAEFHDFAKSLWSAENWWVRGEKTRKGHLGNLNDGFV